MCGIAGIWGNGNINPMIKNLIHRGPDDEGFHASGAVTIGARRLSVIDLETGHQPIHNEDMTSWIVFNGMLFNYLELKKELISLGHSFYTETDTEVLLHAYEQYGAKCLDKFNGMFAFAIWNQRELFLARDRVGEKPLFYYHANDLFIFASEIKGILTQVKTDPFLPQDYLIFETPIEPNTLFKDIWALEPASYLIFDGKKITKNRYWTLNSEPEQKTEKYLVEKLRWLVEDSVKIRLRSDVPVGLFLSGGLDSALIASIAKPETVFSCYFPYGEKYEEIEYARLMASKIRAKHYEITPDYMDFQKNYKEIIWFLDQPVATPSCIAEFSLAKLAKKHVTVIIGGQGADEIFGGYTRYLLMMAENRLSAIPQLKNYFSLAEFFWNPNIFKDPCKRYFQLVNRSGAFDTELFEEFTRVFSRGKTLIDKMGLADIKYTLPSLLTMNDRAAASVGLENRCPYLDHRIIEFAFTLPEEMKIKEYTSKYLLRKVAKGLVPDLILDRVDKMGLVVPIYQWFDGPLKPWVNELLQSFYKRNILSSHIPPKRGEFDRSIYSLISLELWFRTFFDARETDCPHS